MFTLRAIFDLLRNAVPISLRTGTGIRGEFYKFSVRSHNKMVDPRRVVSFEDMRKVIKQPEKVIIDVRDPDEVQTTGKIPSSINIPLSSMHDTLVSMPEQEFKKRYNRNKPKSSDELIFYCKSGKRSTEALDKALKLGYSNSKTYLGSWNEWSSKHGEDQ